MKSNTGGGVLAATLLLVASLFAAPPAQAMSKSEYANAWATACVSEGRHSSIPLSSSEEVFLSSAIPSYARTLASMGGQSASAVKKRMCACMAKRLASHKSNLATPNSSDAVVAAMKSCS